MKLGVIMADVVGLGIPVMDLLVNVKRLIPGNSQVIADETFHQGGGNMASAMAASARLGAKTGILAKVGGNATGDFVIKDLAYNGVDTSHILRGAPDTSSPYCIAISEVEPGTRMFIVNYGKPANLEPEELDYDYIAAAKVLHLEAGNRVSMAAARFAREKGLTVSIDAGAFTQDRVDIIPYIDIFIGSEMFYEGMFPENLEDLEGNCRKLHEMGPRVVWITRGPKGCVGLAEGKFYDVPTFDVPVRDTTGAGDVFHGAYIAALLEGLSPPECASYAGAVSSLKCMYVGGRTAIPNRKTLEKFLKDGVIDTGECEERLAYYRGSFLST